MTTELGVPAMIGRPQFVQTNYADLRNWMRVTDKERRRVDRFTPIVARLESFGNQGATTSTAWTYNQPPCKNKYSGGTAQGGFVLFPPEVGIEDNANLTPSGVTLTNPYLATVPQSYFASGTPDITTGKIKSGWRWTVDVSGNELWEQLSSAAVATNGFRLVPAAGQANMTVGLWDSLGGFWGSLTPTRLSAARTYTLPDSSGTLGFGSVTSVGLSLPAEFTVSGSPVTGAGTLTGAWANESANTVFSGPSSGIAATPGFRALVAADIPNLDTSKLTTGILPIARGGTNSGTALNNNRTMVSSGGGIVEAVAATNGQLLIGSTGAAPVVAALSPGANIGITNGAGSITVALSGTVPIANGGTNGATATAGFNNLSPITTKGDLISSDGTNNVRVAVGTNTQVLTADSTQAAGVKWAAAAGSGAMTLVQTQKITVAVTSVTFSGLNGNADGTYVILGHLVNNGSGGRLDLQPNSITTNQSYAYVLGDGTAVSTGKGTTMAVAFPNPPGAGTNYADIEIVFDPDLSNGATIRFCTAEAPRPDGTGVDHLAIHSMWNEGSTNVTSLVLAHSLASGIGANSTFSLYKITR